MVKVRKNYEPSERVILDFRKKDKKTGELKYVPGRTKQAEMAACDINNILARYESTGALPDMIMRDPQYGDFTNVPTYIEAFETVLKAQDQFEALPAKVRDRFQNDPIKMLEFVNDPKNAQEMIELGMRVPAVEEGKKGEAVVKQSTTQEEKKA